MVSGSGKELSLSRLLFWYFFKYFTGPGSTLCFHWGGFSTSFRSMWDCWWVNGALPLSKAGDRSTSLGMMPRLSKLYMPSLMSFSVMGGGSAKGSSLKFFGRILFGWKTLFGRLVPIPSFSSSILLIPPWDLPYLKEFGSGKEYFSLKMLCPATFSGSLVRYPTFCSVICVFTFLLIAFISSVGLGESNVLNSRWERPRLLSVAGQTFWLFNPTLPLRFCSILLTLFWKRANGVGGFWPVQTWKIQLTNRFIKYIPSGTGGKWSNWSLIFLISSLMELTIALMLWSSDCCWPMLTRLTLPPPLFREMLLIAIRYCCGM